jgi:hypothetical protein
MSDPGPCCAEGAHPCVFAKALFAHEAGCALARRQSLGERAGVECGSPSARLNCSTLAALLRERARFALRLPPEGRPLLHQQALRLQCGGLAALQATLGAAQRDVHELVGQAQRQHGSLTDLPWAELVPQLAAWAPRRRRPAAP